MATSPNTIARLSLVLGIAGAALAGSAQLAGRGDGASPLWAMLAWIFGCPLVFAAIILPLVPWCLAWSARRLPRFPVQLALLPLCAVGIAAVVGLGMLMVRFMP